jgi:hypothetical protein
VPARATTDYEALRRAVLDTRGHRDLGLALFLRRGMAAWMRAWSACAALPSPAPDGPTRMAALSWPPGVRGDLTRLLVTMVLTATHTEAHP